MRKLLLLLLVLLLPSLAQADRSWLPGGPLTVSTLTATNFHIDTNDTWFTGTDQGGGSHDIFRVDTGGNLDIDVPSGEFIQLSENGSVFATLDAGEMQIVTPLELAASGNIGIIRSGFTDERIDIYGGGTANTTDGAIMFINGDDSGGTNAGGDIYFRLGKNAASIFQIDSSHSNNSLGWSIVVPSAATCAATCTDACVVGLDSGAFVACSATHSGQCLCSGS